MKAILGLFAVALFVTALGLSLGAFSTLLRTLLVARVQRAQNYLGLAAFRLGLIHGAGLFLLLLVSNQRPLVGLFALLWLVFAVFAVGLGLAGLIERLGFALWPEANPVRRSLQTGLLVGWGCLLPWAGQLLGLGLILAAYGAGLSAWMREKKPRNPPLPTEGEGQQSMESTDV